MRSLFKALKSLRLAIALIAYIAVTGILASLLPQGRDASYYRSVLPSPLAAVVLGSGFSDFYRSPLFLLPSFLFFANLAACTADRFAREIRKGKAGSHGPDLLHLGLILLLAGAVLGQVARQSHPDWQGYARLGKGDAVRLPDGRTLVLLSLQNLKYPDGRNKDWISTIALLKAGKVQISSYDIRVNHPLRLGPLSIFQSSYGSERVLVLGDGSEASRSLAVGEAIVLGGRRFTLLSIDAQGGGASLRDDGDASSKTISLAKGDKLGGLTVEGAEDVELSGLRAAYDPFYPLVVVALCIVGLGGFWTFARKIGVLEA